MRTPHWTVFYDLKSTEGYVSRAYEFFNTEHEANKRYYELHKEEDKNMPTKRPFHKVDYAYLIRHEED